MKELTLNTPAASVKGASIADRWMRRAILKRLDRLRAGQILLDEGGEYRRLGRAGDLEARIRVHAQEFYRRVALGGELGAAESFIDGDWSADDLPAALRIFAREVGAQSGNDVRWGRLRALAEKPVHALRRNTRLGSARNIHAHYDLGNSFFELFLDDTMNYSAGIFETPDSSMREASVAKMDRACRKLRLKPGDHLLEIGTGWGGLALHAATRFGCRVTTTTISAEQHALATKRVRAAGLESRVNILLEDYRKLSGTYDKLVSIEMIEAVGHEFLESYFRQCGRLLKPHGLMLLQAIVTPEHRYDESRRSVDFIRRYIFPGSCLMSVGRISEAVGRTTDFRTLHVEDIGPHYAETLRRWRQQFLANLDAVRRLGYDERFIRMWDYYLAYCEAGFEERIVGDVQMLFERPASRVGSLLGPLADIAPISQAGAA